MDEAWRALLFLEKVYPNEVGLVVPYLYVSFLFFTCTNEASTPAPASGKKRYALPLTGQAPAGVA